MKATLQRGSKHRFRYQVPATKTVPHLYPEVPDFQAMPEVFATGFMVGLMEWTCMQLLAPHLDAGERSLGVHIDVSHTAATPPGLTVAVEAECVAIEGPRITFHVRGSRRNRSDRGGASSALRGRVGHVQRAPCAQGKQGRGQRARNGGWAMRPHG